MERTDELPFLWQETFATLFSATNKLQVKGDAALELLTMRQLMLMIAILHSPEEDTTIVNLSKAMGSSKQSTTQIVDILKRKGYLTSTRSPKDGRAVNLLLTEDGARVLEQEFETGIGMFKQFFKGFSEAELSQFWGYLKRLSGYDEAQPNQEADYSTEQAAAGMELPEITVESLDVVLGQDVMAKLAKQAKGKEGLVLTIGILQDEQRGFKVFGEELKTLPYERNANVYELGSITKTFTTTLLTKYLSEGRIGLEDTIDKYLLLPEGRHATIRQLATHTAGYPQLLPLTLGSYAGKILKSDNFASNPFAKNISREEMLELAASKSSGGIEAPYVYSNFGMGVLGVILGEISGQSWWEEMNNFIQEELRLRNTRPGSQPGMLAGRNGRKVYGNWAWSPDQYIAPAAALSGTPEDLLQYGYLHMTGAKPYMALAHQRYATKVGEHDVGLAWELRQESDTICHTGNTGCFSTYVGFSKKKQAVVTIQSNHLMSNVGKLGQQILAEL